MFKAIYQHILMLFIYKHKGKGLITSFSFCVFLYLISLLFHELRYVVVGGMEFGLIKIIVNSIIFLAFYRFLGSAKTNAFYLLAIGVDIMGAIFLGATEGALMWILLLWQITAWFNVVKAIDKVK